MTTKQSTINFIDSLVKDLIDKMWNASEAETLRIRDQIYNLNQWRNEFI